jgi:hypothetical protein
MIWYIFHVFVIVANWDGFIDRETGMLGYTIFVGLTECEDLVHQHHDPEKHLFDKSQWTRSAMISPIPAPYTILPGEIDQSKTRMDCGGHVC